LNDHIMPPKAASREPMPKVTDTTLLTSTAIKRAASMSVETARIAMPILVLLTIQRRTIRSAKVKRGIIRLIVIIETEPK